MASSSSSSEFPNSAVAVQSQDSLSSYLDENLILKSLDGEDFMVTKSIAVQCQTIKHILEDDCYPSIIPVQVDSKYLRKVIEYCEKHAAGEKISSSDLKTFDSEFTDVSTDDLYLLLIAANYLEVKSLLDLLCKKVANMIAGKTAEQIRLMFNIKNDLKEDKGKGKEIVAEN